MNGYFSLCKDAGVVDKVACKASDLDRIFIATNAEQASQAGAADGAGGGTRDAQLERHEILEVRSSWRLSRHQGLVSDGRGSDCHDGIAILEALTRTAVAKFIEAEKPPVGSSSDAKTGGAPPPPCSVAEAVGELMARHFGPDGPLDVPEPDAFRRRHLYKPATGAALFGLARELGEVIKRGRGTSGSGLSFAPLSSEPPAVAAR